MPKFAIDTSTPAKKVRIAIIALVALAAIFGLGYLAGQGLYRVVNDDGAAASAPAATIRTTAPTAPVASAAPTVSGPA